MHHVLAWYATQQIITSRSTCTGVRNVHREIWSASFCCNIRFKIFHFALLLTISESLEPLLSLVPLCNCLTFFLLVSIDNYFTNGILFGKINYIPIRIREIIKHTHTQTHTDTHTHTHTHTHTQKNCYKLDSIFR